MIEVTNLQKISGPNTLLDIDSLAINPGEIAAVIGPVDGGRKELFAILTGQVRPTSGAVRILGLDPLLKWSHLSGRVGVLFAENGLYDRMSARANLVFHCKLRGLPASRANDVLVEVGLADQAAVLARQLPAGLARRLAFGRIILHRPQALLLMDPFVGCDTASITLLSRLMRGFSEQGQTILILSGEGMGLANLCRAIYILEQGRLTQASPLLDERRAELPFKVPARQEGRVVLINPADILFISAEEGQTCLHTHAGAITSHLTLGDLEDRLIRNGFFRAHRSYLVNLQRVKAVIPYTRDSFTLILDDPANTEIPLSKTSARELRDSLGY